MEDVAKLPHNKKLWINLIFYSSDFQQTVFLLISD